MTDEHEIPRDYRLDTNVYKHAVRELDLAGVTDDDKKFFLGVIREYAGLDTSGGAYGWYVSVLVRLMQMENLMDLTDDSEEWNQVSDEVGSEVWQSSRNPEAFSQDGGKTYYLLSEVPGGDPNKRHEVIRISRDHTKPLG